MPPTSKSIPSYRHHRARGQGVVTLDGRDYYFGAYKTASNRAECDRLIAEWLANRGSIQCAKSSPQDLTIKELVLRYWYFAETRYLRDGNPTREVEKILEALGPLL